MGKREREITGNPQSFRKLKQVQEDASELVVTHFDAFYRKLPKTKGSDLILACAFIMYGYHILRSQRAESQAVDTFDALAHFSRLCIEEGRARAKLSKMH